MDENLRVADRHAPTIGILLCAGRNDHVMRYSLAGTTAPLAVANYAYDTLPEPIRELVPTDRELADAVDATWDELTTDRTDGDNLQT
ncbi:PDDEXK nuclease domain-containing protein [Rhodococcus pyridinivorans]|uniref:PDDEXK nuclease domain-containing protein n=1 Tax=Rhodococcus pyridinivorans TaxID=103816 RepID=UPI00223F125A|nr:PDDEXK nuclease domain-containing protein [Rhodococcus pyridinivorans]WMM73078.1 PDDEXK nuclease domain-containing protein [Rhodococcus pyridinivorans]